MSKRQVTFFSVLLILPDLVQVLLCESQIDQNIGCSDLVDELAVHSAIQPTLTVRSALGTLPRFLDLAMPLGAPPRLYSQKNDSLLF